jgi:hypothetical protein
MLRWKKTGMFFMLVLLPVIFITCGADQMEKKAAATIENDQPVVTFEDGSQYVGNEAISTAFNKYFEKNPDSTIAVDINLDESGKFFSANQGNVGAVQQDATPIPIGFGYYVLVYYDKHPIGACINRTVSHVNFKITKKGTSGSVFNLHIASWNDGKRCIAVYMSDPKYFCQKICMPRFKDLVGGIAGALIVAGLSYSVAWSLAYILAPMAGLAFI